MANGKEFKMPEFKPKQQPMAQIIGMNATVVAKCPCGQSLAMLIPVIPGAGGGTQCPACQTIWQVEAIQYKELPRTEENPQGSISIHIQFRATVPKILHAPAGILPGV